MRKKIQHFFHAMFPGQLEFRELINRIVMLMVFACSVIGVVLILLGADHRVIYGLLSISVVSGISIYLTVVKHNSKGASWLLLIGINGFLFPYLFLTGGGTQSGMPVWFVLGLVYVFLLFEGRSFIPAMILSVLAFLGAYLLGYYYPEIVPDSTRFYSFSDSYIALVCVSAFIGIVLKLQSGTYERERELAEKQRQEVEQIARSKDTFFANMSHEIRTPINTIIGLNEMILREDISDEIAENAINIQNASKMLLTTINDILDLSKLESGKMDIVPVQYEIGTMFSDLVNLVWIRAHQKDLEFKVDIDPEIPSMLYGDEVRIKQVVTNLLTNAVKYTQTGSVTLTAKGERVAADQILLRISVEDTGMGIRKESLDDLFSSFKRVDETQNRNIEGTGLGLSISQQLMEMMGGKITVDSVYHKGSVFTIELKQRIINVRPIGVINFAAQKQMNQRARYRQTFIAPDARILVVDDNSMNLMVAVKLLRDTKVRVDTAESGKEALKKTAENAYHLILMDHMMPEMDGEATLHALRTQTKGYCQKTPVIALTANVMSDAEQVYRNMGFDGYLAKPISTPLLEASLLQYLPHELIEYLAKEEPEEETAYEGPNQVVGVRKRKVAITADCICDLPKDLLERFKIRLMYCYVHTGEGRFCDLFEISADSLLNYLQTEGNESHSSTAEPSEYEYFFAETLTEAEHVLHITATSDLSGAFPNASQAAGSFGNVTIFDSGHISSGHGLMVLYAAVLAEEGKTVSEICEALESYKERVFSNFLVPSTDTLHRCGKVSGAVHKLCAALNLHPVLAMSKNRLKLWRIETGNMHRATRQYVKKLLGHSEHIDTRILFLTYAGCNVAQIDEILSVVERYVKFDKIILQPASATVSSNCGIGTFGLMFVRKEKQES
ncbi:MAG: DegV family EDD domain-containing protein [Bacteroidales bacterium]|nr:DegV family EDD domain-containing protein [Bacteroidales bacterium]MCM1416269.1 DegV family EDD domain-containing protein [bacterium]MCM1422375.1 DegV family EDD domain-containing protein [bacterium]